MLYSGIGFVDSCKSGMGWYLDEFVPYNGLILVETKFNAMEPSGMGHLKMFVEWNTKSSLGWTFTDIARCFVEGLVRMVSGVSPWLLLGAPLPIPYTTCTHKMQCYSMDIHFSN
jgi:hypothetical protein